MLHPGCNKRVTGVTQKGGQHADMQLYDYQSNLIDNLSRSWREGYKRPCIVLPCGGGKSVIASEIAKRTTDNHNRVLFMVHRQELCDQIYNTFNGYGVDMDL